MSVVFQHAGTAPGAQLTLAMVSGRGELSSPLPPDPSTAPLSFHADLVTLGRRVERHRPWALKETPGRPKFS